MKRFKIKWPLLIALASRLTITMQDACFKPRMQAQRTRIHSNAHIISCSRVLYMSIYKHATMHATFLHIETTCNHYVPMSVQMCACNFHFASVANTSTISSAALRAPLKFEGARILNHRSE